MSLTNALETKSWRRQGTESAVEVAVREGAVAVNVPDDGVKVSDAT